MTIPIHNPDVPEERKRTIILFRLGFRPFFLAAGLFSMLLMGIFVFNLAMGDWHGTYLSLSLWHGHEMIFGYAVAVIAGFLLTAVKNWTGIDTVTGKGLLLLFLIWLAGRFVLVVPDLPGWLVVSVDIVFLPLLALVILRPIMKSGQSRNVSVVTLLMLMAAGNGLFHAQVLEFSFASMEPGLAIGVGAVLMLMSVIGGRVMPFFIEKGLSGASVVKIKWLELAATPLIAIWLLLELLTPDSIWQVLAAFVAAMAHGIRLFGWGNLRIWKAPMLWVICMAYGWLVIGFILQGLAGLQMIPGNIALHAWTVGAIGMFTLGMMARVSLGHTGRAMIAHRAMVIGFVTLGLTALTRVFVPLLFPAMMDVWLLIAGTGWILAFALFVWIYAPYLVQVRADGRDD